MKKILLLLLFILIGCTGVQTKYSEEQKQIQFLSKVMVYERPSIIYLKEFPPSEKKASYLKHSILRWNEWIGRKVFHYESSFLSFLQKDNKVYLFNGDDNSFCEGHFTLLGFAIPEVSKENESFIRGGKIYLCSKKIAFLKRTGWPSWTKNISEQQILTHELGHFLIKKHALKSNIMYPFYRVNGFPNDYDKRILFPAIAGGKVHEKHRTIYPRKKSRK